MDGYAGIEIVDHVYVAPDYADRINRTTTGTRRESRFTLLTWNIEILTLQDYVELEGDPNTPGTGVMYEIVEITHDYRRIASQVAYIIRRKQDQVDT